ncbi:16S rRNA (cytidine(1402)-2'-O)-methyltransferase [Agaribacter flavus]|uniref:Ribosomal RNA small subunit methyltransferase I n=1 Tax=Agaribacter flavus TaxID=1902781 RepID=A0ABV7FPM3_9ALTE
MSAGSLFIVPTPIGNLSDMTPRAIEVLASVDLIAAEDTRHSGKLLQHFEIKTNAISLHAHNESARSEYIVDKLLEGLNVALISDAGTPLISDPGFELVNRCREKGVMVSALPGACALTTALSACGLPTDKFTFSGFLPVKIQARESSLLQAIDSAHTHVFYESPKRILDTLTSIEKHRPEAQVVIAKELSKTFETYQKGAATDLIKWLSAEQARQKGEFVLIVYQAKEKVPDALPDEAKKLLGLLLPLLPPKKAATVVAEQYSLNKKQVYQHSISIR